jgi:hypothetical protein
LEKEVQEETEKLRLEYIERNFHKKNTNCVCFYILNKYTSDGFHAATHIKMLTNQIYVNNSGRKYLMNQDVGMLFTVSHTTEQVY